MRGRKKQTDESRGEKRELEILGAGARDLLAPFPKNKLQHRTLLFVHDYRITRLRFIAVVEEL
jgi:hypothetical protein